MNIKKIVTFINIFILIFFFGTSCKTFGFSTKSNFVYSIKNVELIDNKLIFDFKNCSLNKIKNFSIKIEFWAKENLEESDDFFIYEKDFFCDIESLEKSSFAIDLKDYLHEIDFTFDEEKSVQDFFYIERIYATEIVFYDNPRWFDKYGNWSF